MPQLPVEQGSPEWFAARLGRITASHAAGCLRRNKNEGPLGAFNAIMGITQRQANEYMKYGLKHEQEARESYWRWAGQPLIEPGGFYTHPVYDWLGASPDGIVRPDGCLQIKCPQITPPDCISEAHEIQVRIEMACCGAAWVDYWAWHETGAYYHERLFRDLDIEAALIADLKVFYEAHILTNTPPPLRAKKEKNRGVLANDMAQGRAADLDDGSGEPVDGPSDG